MDASIVISNADVLIISVVLHTRWCTRKANGACVEGHATVAGGRTETVRYRRRLITHPSEKSQRASTVTRLAIHETALWNPQPSLLRPYPYPCLPKVIIRSADIQARASGAPPEIPPQILNQNSFSLAPEPAPSTAGRTPVKATWPSTIAASDGSTPNPEFGNEKCRVDVCRRRWAVGGGREARGRLHRPYGGPLLAKDVRV